VHPEDVAVAAHQSVFAVPGDASERGAAFGVDDQACVDRKAPRLLADADLALVQVADVVAGEVERRDAGPAGVHGLLGEVLLGAQPQRRRLHAHREVLGDDRDVLPVLREVHGDGQDPRVVVAEPDACREDRGVGVCELHAKRAPFTDLDREVQSPVLDAQVVEVSQRLACEVPDLRVVTFALELCDHDDRKDDRVLGEPEERLRITQQDRGVEDIRPQILIRLRG